MQFSNAVKEFKKNINLKKFMANKKTIGGILVVLAVVSSIVLLNNQTSPQSTSTDQIKYYPIKNMLGVNAHPWDLTISQGEFGEAADKKGVEKLNAIISTGFSWLRIYLDAYNAKSADNKTFGFNPTINNGGGFHWENAIATLKSKNPNIKTNICYQNLPLNLQAEWQAAGKKSTQYRRPNTDPSKPETWYELASDMAVLAARGGKNMSAANYPLFVSPNWWEPKQEMKKGTGLYDQLEIQNELDNPWSNDYPLTGAQHSVLWKTTYDAIKKVDSTMLVSTTGVTPDDPKILTEAIAWSKANNGGKLPFDKYQFHCYPWGWNKGVTAALPPEYNMIPAAKKVVALGVPSVVGEWGFDINADSEIGIRTFSNYTAEQVRQNYVARSILGFAVTGIESAYYFTMYQHFGFETDKKNYLFATSGLFVEENNMIHRRLHAKTFQQLAGIGEYVYDSTLIDSDFVKLYRLKLGEKKILTGWTVEKVDIVTEPSGPNGQWTTNKPKFTERKFNYRFPKGTRLDLTEDTVMKSTSFAGGVIELSSKPVFVLVDTPQPEPHPHPISLSKTKILFSKGYNAVDNKRLY